MIRIEINFNRTALGSAVESETDLSLFYQHVFVFNTTWQSDLSDKNTTFSCKDCSEP